MALQRYFTIKLTGESRKLFRFLQYKLEGPYRKAVSQQHDHDPGEYQVAKREGLADAVPT